MYFNWVDKYLRTHFLKKHPIQIVWQSTSQSLIGGGLSEQTPVLFDMLPLEIFILELTHITLASFINVFILYLSEQYIFYLEVIFKKVTNAEFI